MLGLWSRWLLHRYGCHWSRSACHWISGGFYLCCSFCDANACCCCVRKSCSSLYKSDPVWSLLFSANLETGRPVGVCTRCVYFLRGPFSFLLLFPLMWISLARPAPRWRLKLAICFVTGLDEFLVTLLQELSLRGKVVFEFCCHGDCFIFSIFLVWWSFWPKGVAMAVRDILYLFAGTSKSKKWDILGLDFLAPIRFSDFSLIGCLVVHSGVHFWIYFDEVKKK